MEDTVTLARHVRKKQGLWEAEVSCGREVDLHRHLVICDKNPGHHQFVPVDDFNVGHLPPGCQDNDFVDFVRDLANSTVRVSVNYVSDKRPEAFLGSGIQPYPCYKSKVKNMMRTGTGWISEWQKHTDDDVLCKTCQCPECLGSPEPHTHFAYFCLITAKHVIYDDQEAANSTCQLFFDRGRTPDECSGVVTLRGMSVISSDDANDIIKVRYVTHDLNFVHRMDEISKRLYGIWMTSYERYRHEVESETQTSPRPVDVVSEFMDSHAIIVSHPHGCSKQISIGRYSGTGDQFGAHFPNTYTAATCPGSSGALIYVVKEGRLLYWGQALYHSGSCGENAKLNFSSMANLKKSHFFP